MHLSQIWKKKIMKQFHSGKFIWIYHLERGTILSRPQSIAAETWLPFQVWTFLYLIQISPEVRNEIENVVFKIKVTLSLPQRVNTSRQRQCGRYFADHYFKFIFMYDNYANPVYGVATICHQFRCLRWGQPSLFHAALSLLIWYKMLCMRDITYRLNWMKFVNMLSVYAQSGTHRHVNWWIIAVLT